jgi:hypothetical protein
MSFRFAGPPSPLSGDGARGDVNRAMRPHDRYSSRAVGGKVPDMNGSHANHRRRWIARWAIAGLLCHVFLSAWHTPLMALALGADGSPFARTIIICTSDGVRLIRLDQDDNPVEVPAPINYGDVCQINLLVGADHAGCLNAAPKLHHPGVWHREPFADFAETLTDRRPYVRCGLDPPKLS